MQAYQENEDWMTNKLKLGSIKSDRAYAELLYAKI